MGRGVHVSDDDLVAAVGAAGPVATTTEVLAETELSTRSHLAKRLDALRDAGRIGGREVGQAKVWWLPGATLP